MNKETRDRLGTLSQAGKPPAPVPVSTDVDLQKEVAEAEEVAGRHKNDGQDDFKSTRSGA